MTDRATIREAVLQALARIAPESAERPLAPDVNIRDQIDFDSVDFLNFALALGEALHVDIPEQDFPKLSTIDGCVRYLAQRL